MIPLRTEKTDSELFGHSKWWGFPDMPQELDYPQVPVNVEGDVYDDPLTFVCQIRCSDIAALDSQGLLPHRGMLYFFAALDYFLGNIDADVAPGMGEWSRQFFKVLYSPSCDDLHTHRIVYDDGTPACLPAETIVFGVAGESHLPGEASPSDETRLLGEPFFDEVRQEMPGMISLLQIDGNDSWDLRFFDCGMLNFLISPKDLAARRWDHVRCYLHSF